MNSPYVMKLVKEAENIPKLEYSTDIFTLRDNVDRTIKAVKRRLGVLQELKGEIDYEITVNHLEVTDEES